MAILSGIKKSIWLFFLTTSVCFATSLPHLNSPLLDTALQLTEQLVAPDKTMAIQGIFTASLSLDTEDYKQISAYIHQHYSQVERLKLFQNVGISIIEEERSTLLPKLISPLTPGEAYLLTDFLMPYLLKYDGNEAIAIAIINTLSNEFNKGRLNAVLVDYHCKKNHFPQAFDVLDSMPKNLSKDQSIMSCVTYLCESKRFEDAQHWIEEIQSKPIRQKARQYLSDYYAIDGQWEASIQTQEKNPRSSLTKGDSVLLNALQLAKNPSTMDKTFVLLDTPTVYEEKSAILLKIATYFAQDSQYETGISILEKIKEPDKKQWAQSQYAKFIASKNDYHFCVLAIRQITPDTHQLATMESYIIHLIHNDQLSRALKLIKEEDTPSVKDALYTHAFEALLESRQVTDSIRLIRSCDSDQTVLNLWMLLRRQLASFESEKLFIGQALQEYLSKFATDTQPISLKFMQLTLNKSPDFLQTHVPDDIKHLCLGLFGEPIETWPPQLCQWLSAFKEDTLIDVYASLPLIKKIAILTQWSKAPITQYPNRILTVR